MHDFRSIHPLCCVFAVLASLLLTGFLHAAPPEPTRGAAEDSVSPHKLAYQKLKQLRDDVAYEEKLSWMDKMRMLRSAYANSVLGQMPDSQAALESMSTQNLRLDYEAAAYMAFYTGDGTYTEASRRYLDVLAQRGKATQSDYEELYRNHVNARQFKRARILLEMHPDMDVEALGPVIEAMPKSGGIPSVLSFQKHTESLVHRPASLDTNRQILIIAHPLCHFTRNAVRELVQHPRLWRTLTEHALWLAPRTGRINANEIRSWNKAIPRARIVIAYKQDEWPMVDYWGLPSFYFMRNGSVVDKVIGWPPQGNLKGIAHGMRALGLDTERYAAESGHDLDPDLGSTLSADPPRKAAGTSRAAQTQEPLNRNQRDGG